MLATRTKAQTNRSLLYAGLIFGALTIFLIHFAWSHAPETSPTPQVQLLDKNQLFESEQAGSVTTIRFLL
ncbi:MAG: hypothetical protein M3Z35_13630, partial [Nitrospirota bacterium]|nr:hypothetical protein [Nitrospirota bacterium]